MFLHYLQLLNLLLPPSTNRIIGYVIIQEWSVTICVVSFSKTDGARNIVSSHESQYRFSILASR